jgi:hypothetical protein
VPALRGDGRPSAPAEAARRAAWDALWRWLLAPEEPEEQEAAADAQPAPGQEAGLRAHDRAPVA